LERLEARGVASGPPTRWESRSPARARPR
jgi:hypothetical protein